MPKLIAHASAVEQVLLILVQVFIYTHTLQVAKELVSLHIYTDLPEQ